MGGFNIGKHFLGILTKSRMYLVQQTKYSFPKLIAECLRYRGELLCKYRTLVYYESYARYRGPLNEVIATLRSIIP